MISTDAVNGILNYFFRKGELSQIKSPYLGLCAKRPANDGSLTNAGEPSSANGSQYGRKPIDEYDFTTPKNGMITNAREIQFPTAKGEGWGKLDYWFLSSGSGTSALLWGDLTEIVASGIDITSFENDSDSNTVPAVLTLRTGQTYRFECALEGAEIPFTLMLDATWDNPTSCFNLTGNDNNDDTWEFTYTPSYDTTGSATGTLKLTVKPDTADLSTWTTLSIYHAGVNVLPGVVPTFAAGTLSASIDAANKQE